MVIVAVLRCDARVERKRSTRYADEINEMAAVVGGEKVPRSVLAGSSAVRKYAITRQGEYPQKPRWSSSSLFCCRVAARCLFARCRAPPPLLPAAAAVVVVLVALSGLCSRHQCLPPAHRHYHLVCSPARWRLVSRAQLHPTTDRVRVLALASLPSLVPTTWPSPTLAPPPWWMPRAPPSPRRRLLSPLSTPRPRAYRLLLRYERRRRNTVEWRTPLVACWSAYTPPRPPSLGVG